MRSKQALENASLLHIFLNFHVFSENLFSIWSNADFILIVSAAVNKQLVPRLMIYH